MDQGNLFPRGLELPKQSPLFWVQQKDRYLRQLLIKDIQRLTSRKLVVYFANRYLDNSGINTGDISHLHEVLEGAGGAPVDLLLNTSGGQTDATEALVSLLQSSTPDLRVLVPHSAKSNGTMICLAAKNVVMGPTSELGPIDPYLGDTPTSILAEDVVREQNFALHKLAIFAIQQTKKLATKLLTNGMMRGRPENEIAETVEKLSSRREFFSHGSAIDHVEAKELGINVEYHESGGEFWDRLWLLYAMYEHDAGRDGLVKIFEGEARSLSISQIS